LFYINFIIFDIFKTPNLDYFHFYIKTKMVRGYMEYPFKIKRVSPALGALISGIDLSQELDEKQFTALNYALQAYHVLFFRNQPIQPKQQKQFAQQFGLLHTHPIYPHTPECEEIMVLDTDEHNPPDNDNWHTDVTFIETPPMGAVLAAKHIPELGGDTLWASGVAAYSALSVRWRHMLIGLQAVHDFTKSFPEYRFNHSEESYSRWLKAKENNPPILHPAVRTHPHSGRKALFVNEGFTTRIIGLTPKESESTLAFLFEHINKPEFQVRWQWQKDDIVIWDNQMTQHYATADYLPERRIMHRATIMGGVPY
jgi:taurine dioxygenase